MGELIHLSIPQEHWQAHLEASQRGAELAQHKLDLLQNMGQLTLKPQVHIQGVHPDSIAHNNW